MARRTVTIDIDDTSVRLLEMEGRRVSRWATSELEPGLVHNEIVVEPEMVGATIRHLLRSSGIRARRALVSISGAYGFSRILVVKRIAGQDLDATVLRAIREVAPIPLEGLYYAWRRLGATEDGHQVLLVAVPRSVVSPYVEALRGAGLRVASLTIRSLALASTVQVEDAIVLNVKPFSVDIALIVDGTPQVLHTVFSRGSGNHAAGLENGRGSDEEAAEHVAAALDRAVGFYNQRHEAEALDDACPVLVGGSDVNDVEFLEELSAKTGRSVQPLSDDRFPEHLPFTQYASNIGLAVSGGGRGRGAEGLAAGMNLLAGERGISTGLSLGRVTIGLALAAALLLLAFMFQGLSSAQDRTGLLEAELRVAQTQMEVLQRQNTRRAELQRTIGELEEISAKRGGITQDWELVDGLFGEGLTLTSIGFSETSLDFQLTADSLERGERFVEELRQQERFCEECVVLPREAGSPIPGQTVAFSIKANFSD